MERANVFAWQSLYKASAVNVVKRNHDNQDLGVEKNNEKEPLIIAANPMGLGNVENITNCYEITHSQCYLIFSQLVNGILTTACVLLGTIGNLHSIKSIHMTNLDKNKGVVLAVSILALAFWDTILLWCAFFYYGMSALTRAHNSDTTTLLTPWFHGFSQIANTASIWCVVAITVQRFMASRDPFRCSRSSRTLLSSFRGERRSSSLSMIYCSTNRRHFRMPILLSFAAILLNIPAFFEIESHLCRRKEGRYGYGLHISKLRLNPYYQIWYKVVFRMIMTSCVPNIFILLLTSFTIYLLKGTNRSRRQLFHMSESLSDRFSSKEAMQTMISLMLVIKYLLFRSPSFFLDVIEVTIGYRGWVQIFIYGADLSNFLVILNSATNCLIFLRGPAWLQGKITHRNTIRNRKQLFSNLQTSTRIALLQSSWTSVQTMTSGQFGARIVYSMLRKDPSLFDVFTTVQYDGEETPLRQTSGLIARFYNFGSIPDKTPPNNGEETPLRQTSGLIARKSFDLLTCPQYYEVGDRIMNFMGELIQMMQDGQSEQAIIERIRLVGATHYERNVMFSSCVWREFKASTLAIVGESTFESESIRVETLKAWSSFVSLIIREMKNGIWMSRRSSQDCKK
ncbi:hypothetical protein Tcan_08540 [Toxocara canis]|uniref:G-protein coupled receptors family 1 profile domain-containing protein n=1 Tax=Toxocara canis TaxID=6265 RepID=A0A0B2VIR8_TOXCA|nr:hypothetical protein Tcan_08540 [Toxocara canis]